MIIILINAAKKHFQKDFIKLVNNSVFGKTVENFQKHRSIKLMKIKKKRMYLVSEQNYHTTNFFTETLLTIEMRKTQIHVSEICRVRFISTIS